MTIKKLGTDLRPSIPVAPKPQPPPAARPSAPQAPAAPASNVAQGIRADASTADRTANQLAAQTVSARVSGALLPTGLGGGTTVEGINGPVDFGDAGEERSAGPTVVQGINGPVVLGGTEIEPPERAGPTVIQGYTGPVVIGGAEVERAERAGPTVVQGYTGPVVIGGAEVERPERAGPTVVQGYTGPVVLGGAEIDRRPSSPTIGAGTPPRRETTTQGINGPVVLGGSRVGPGTAPRTSTVDGINGPVVLGGPSNPARPTTTQGFTGPVSFGEANLPGSLRRSIQDFDTSSRLDVHNIGFEGEAGPASYSGDASTDGVEGEVSTTVGNPDGNRLGAGVGFSVSETEDVSTSDGYTTAVVTGEVSFNAEASAKLGGFGVGAGVEFTSTQTQTVRVPEDDWAAIEDGTAPYPTQYDPYSIPVGGTVTTNNSDSTNTELNASYRGFSASSGLKETDEISVQVERVDENTVRVTSGPTSTVESTNGIGFDVGVVGANAEVGRTLESAQVTQVEFDISTPEGQAAYDAYIATGEVPAPGTPGVNDVTQTHSVSLEQTTTLGLSVFGYDLSAEFEGSSAHTVLTTHADGTRDQVSTVDGAGFKITARSTFPPDSNEADAVEYTLELENVAGHLVDQLNQVYGADPAGEVPPDQDITLTFSDQDLEELADFAREQLVQENVERGYTREEVEAALDNYDPNDPAGWEFYGDPNWVTIATSDSPDAVAQSVARLVSNEGSSAFVTELINIVTSDYSPYEVGDGTPFDYSGGD